MFKLLDKLREQSESERKRTAIIVSFSLTGIILVAWLMFLSVGSLHSYDKTTDTSSTSPTAAVREAFAAGVGLVGDFITSIQQGKILFSASSSPATSNNSAGSP